MIASLKKTIDQQKFLSKKKEIEISYSFRNKVGNNHQKLDESYFSISESVDVFDEKLLVLKGIFGDQSRYVQIL